MSVPVFTLSLQQQVVPGCVAVGRFDSAHCCLAAACTTNKVVVHSPHARLASAAKVARELSLLNMAQPVRSLAAGQLDPDTDCDALVVGMASSVLAYDVHNNSDLFFKEVADGANVVTVGRLGNMPVPLALVGGNCSLQGFDHQGSDVFWSVTGDNVCSLALIDFDNDGLNELVVGSEDFDIRVFKNDHIISELTETDAVTSLVSFKNAVFGYGLANGTVGVYERLQRLWRVKSKNTAAAVLAYDIDGDGVEELVTGWSNGKVDARSSRTGEVVFKDNMSDAVAGLAAGDYRMVGRNDLICCSVQGEVHGYDAQGRAGREGSHAPPDQDVVRELLSRKQLLHLELRNYVGPDPSSGREVGTIPAKTRLQTGISVSMGSDAIKPHVKITMSTNNETVIRAVMVFAEGIFKGETYVIHPKDSEVEPKVVVPLFPPKNVGIDIHIKALVGTRGSQHFHVFELTRQLPTFSMFMRSECAGAVPPAGHASCHINERLQRIAMWVNQNFLMPEDVEAGAELSVAFTCLHAKEPVALTMQPDGHLVIRTDDMGLAGDLLQSLAAFLNLEHLQVMGEFRAEEARLEQLLEHTSALRDARLRLSTDTADHAGLVRSLVVRAEDARIIGDYSRMKQWYGKLQEVNDDLIRGYQIRLQNYQELVATVKDVNSIVQKAANLRVGKYKTAVVSLCRQALKNGNVSSLVKIVRTGEA